ncbi:MAG: HNH endonuclease [Rhizobiales bacterium]|nr:HNH endonuclease [Hyphomicrobiales bacterium]
MVKITTLKPLVPRSSGYTVMPQPKRADAELQTAEHKAWRLVVCRRAQWQCQWVENGRRCQRSAARGDRMIADHIIERADGGALYDPDNGQCLCTQHNTLKGVMARTARKDGQGG